MHCHRSFDGSEELGQALLQGNKKRFVLLYIAVGSKIKKMKQKKTTKGKRSHS